VWGGDVRLIFSVGREEVNRCQSERGGGTKVLRSSHLVPSLDIQNSPDIKNTEFAYQRELSRSRGKRALEGNAHIE
jgi:hypothetical protein